MTNGTLLIGQSGGATAVINASLAGAIEAAHATGKFERILGLRHGFDGLLHEQFIDLTYIAQDDLDRLRITPGSALGTSRLKISSEQLDQAVEILHRHDVRGVVLIGGNDSADTALALHRRTDGAIASALAPKTVDNDLMGTDVCPGYPSAVRFLANLVRDATWDSLSAPQLYPVKLIEVPGRDAGWLPVGSALGFAEHDADLLPLVFLPEAPPDSVDTIIEAIAQRIDSTGFAVAVIPETLRDRQGKHFGGDEPEYVDPFGHPYFASACDGLARAIRQSMGIRARVERPGSVIRASVSLVSPVDRSLAYLTGRSAVDTVVQGHSGIMIGIERSDDFPPGFTTHPVELSEVANRVRSLPRAYFDQRDCTPTEALAAWALPLLGNDPFPPYVRLGPGR